MAPRLLAFAIVISLLGGVRDARAATVLQDDCSGMVFLTSAAVVTGIAVYDIATAPASARRYNEQHLVIRPRVDPWHGSYGLSASVPFGRARRPPPPAPPSHRSPGAALALSLGLTAVPMAAGFAAGNDAGGWTFLGGLVIGPSVGHIYAGQVGRGLGTAALRAAGTAIGIRSIVNCFSD